MKRIFAPFLLAAFLAPFHGVASAPPGAFLWELPKTLTVTYGAPIVPAPLSASNLRVLVWNVHKGEDARLAKDFAGLSEFADLSLFQEAVSDVAFTAPIVQANPILGWTLATSWEVLENNFTGVATGSKVKPVREEVLVSKVLEPISSTPKTILTSEFSIEGRIETLLVVNVHGINFVSTKSYQMQVDQLRARIAQHVGPMIVAGDFNTWNDYRLLALKKAFSPLGVYRVQIPRSEDFFSLDHIFVRGLSATKIHNQNHISSSDHRPLLVDLSFDPVSAQ